MGGRHFKNWLEIAGKKCTEGQMDLLQVLSLPSLCGIRIAKPHAANPKWKFFVSQVIRFHALQEEMDAPYQV